MTEASETIRLLDTGLLSAAGNMALDEIILEEVAAGRSPSTLRFLRFSPPAALVGGHQDVALELREDYCRRRGVDLNRRITGGGAIYFQTSALGWEIFGRRDREPLRGSYDRLQEVISGAAVKALHYLGVEAGFRPRNDIETDGRKISGTGGAWLENGFMFQGTLLIDNEIEEFLRCLRVPVEKLKKREIESLRERVCFLNDLVNPAPGLDEVKQAFIRAFAELFGRDLTPLGLTAAEKSAFEQRTPYYESPDWIYGRGESRRPRENGVYRYTSLYQTDGGTFRTHLWLDARVRRIRQALITGDFFCRPARLVLDLEAALKGERFVAETVRETVRNFLSAADGEFPGVKPEEVVAAVAAAVERKDLEKLGLKAEEVNEIFIVNLRPGENGGLKPRFLLLPYCSKKVDCDWRKIPDCGRCGECDFDRMYDFGEERDLEVYSIQSFEHLMEVLSSIRDREGLFVGSCCEAFYSKHQKEIEASGARGLLVNLDSTTCYDLGKGMEAYVGDFENKTEMNRDLIEKVVRKTLEG
ncbi:MAG: DUF116 domain-containing protein [Pseudomonadota bacterium]